MPRDLYGFWACDLMKWLTRASARWLTSVPAPTGYRLSNSTGEAEEVYGNGFSNAANVGMRLRF
jgi:hypothetical protein